MKNKQIIHRLYDYIKSYWYNWEVQPMIDVHCDTPFTKQEMPVKEKINCAKCQVECSDRDKYPNAEYCDYCRKKFCSYECSQLEAYEDTFYNCCPGVYWCGLCRNNYFEKAKGHLFFIQNHGNSPDLLTYAGIDSTNGAFVDQCKNCGIWSYEFKSSTNSHSKYEGQPCGIKIREFDNDY